MNGVPIACGSTLALLFFISRSLNASLLWFFSTWFFGCLKIKMPVDGL
jgi:hypothetical protein